MQHLGHTRSSFQRDHLVQTPDTFVRAALPGMRNAIAIVHASPALGARFTAYTVEFERDGRIETGSAETFVYTLEGAIGLESKLRVLDAGQYAWIPPGERVAITSPQTSRAIVIEKEYSALNGAIPSFFAGAEQAVESKPLLGDDALQVRCLIPDGPAFDMAVNTMTFQPGTTLPMVEIHVMEHGLLMLEGEGIYRLGDHWYPAAAGDFIWIAGYCPQWFGALGKNPSKYLIYKDWNRHPLARPDRAG